MESVCFITYKNDATSIKHYWSKSAEEYMIKKIKFVEGNNRKFIFDNEIDQYFKKNTFSMNKFKVLINTFNIYKEKFNLPKDKIIM